MTISNPYILNELANDDELYNQVLKNEFENNNYDERIQLIQDNPSLFTNQQLSNLPPQYDIKNIKQVLENILSQNF
jgi:hypothetical protein